MAPVICTLAGYHAQANPYPLIISSHSPQFLLELFLKNVIFPDALYFLGPGLPGPVVGAGQLSTELPSYGKVSPGQQQTRSFVLLNKGPLGKGLAFLFPHGTQISQMERRTTLFIAWYENGILFGLICSGACWRLEVGKEFA